MAGVAPLVLACLENLGFPDDSRAFPLIFSHRWFPIPEWSPVQGLPEGLEGGFCLAQGRNSVVYF